MANILGNKSNILNFEQKQELVNNHFNSHKTYKELAEFYKISYWTVRRICINYELYGPESLKSKTGKHNNHQKAKVNSLDPKDKELAILRKKVKWLEMENEVIKKFNEMVEEQNKK